MERDDEPKTALEFTRLDWHEVAQGQGAPESILSQLDFRGARRLILSRR
jgi:hypothetical protein